MIYFIEDHHPAILPKPKFEAVQHELQCRSNIITNPDGTKSRSPINYTFRGSSTYDKDEEKLVESLRKHYLNTVQ